MSEQQLGTVKAVCGAVGAVVVGSVSVVAVCQGGIGAVSAGTVVGVQAVGVQAVGVQAVGVKATVWYRWLELSVSALELSGLDLLVFVGVRAVGVGGTAWYPWRSLCRDDGHGSLSVVSIGGLPYAAPPPVGSLRWAPLVPPAPWPPSKTR